MKLNLIITRLAITNMELRRTNIRLALSNISLALDHAWLSLIKGSINKNAKLTGNSFIL